MIFTLCMLILGFLTNSSSTADPVTKQLDAFQSVDVSGNIKLTLIPSDEHKAIINVTKGNIDNLIAEVKGKTLKLKFKNKSGWNWGGNQNKAEIELYFTDLEFLEASAGANVDAQAALSSENMRIDASSGASIKLDIECETLRVEVSSGASLKLEGTANTHGVDVSSGASYNAIDLIAQEVKVDASSGASAKVYASKSLEAEASSGGSIRYKGNPDTTNLDSGRYSGGSIKAIN